MTVGQTRKEVRPGERPGIGVGDIDLELRHDHEQRGHPDRPRSAVEHLIETEEIHLIGVDRLLRGHPLAQQQPRKKRTAQHLEHPDEDPARSAQHHPKQPAPAISCSTLRHEAQIIGLLTHLGNQGDADRHRGSERMPAETRLRALRPGIMPQTLQRLRLLFEQKDERQREQEQPDRLGQRLDPADHGNAVGHQRNHHQRADQIPPAGRNIKRELKRIRHDRGFEREQDEGEGGVDQRRDGGTDVTKSGPAREQVHVHPVTRRIQADRQAGDEDDQTNRKNGPEAVDEAIADQHGGAHRLQHQEGRRTECGVADPELRPLAKTARGKAQRVVLQRLIGHPGVVVPPDLDDTLHRIRRRLAMLGSGRTGQTRLRLQSG